LLYNSLHISSFARSRYHLHQHCFPTRRSSDLFHKEVRTGISSHYEYANNRIEHPLATIDRGFRWVDCTTNLSSLEPNEIANLIRSEEHTSELQSRENLVCRLLLEKKKRENV